MQAVYIIYFMKAPSEVLGVINGRNEVIAYFQKRIPEAIIEFDVCGNIEASERGFQGNTLIFKAIRSGLLS